MKPLVITYLYPAEMNLYGDRGNIIALQQRCRWRGIDTRLDEVHLGANYDFSASDIIFGGGGQDKGQELVAKDLTRHGTSIKSAAERGVPMLLVCGLYQLFGRRFTTTDGLDIPGIGLFKAETIGGAKRLIGNISVESEYGTLIGFENHSGLTKLDSGQKALGRVIKGAGNDGSSGQEGAVFKNVIGTYLHGPILPKNPSLADFLIMAALSHKSGRDLKLEPLDDSLELLAAETASRRPR